MKYADELHTSRFVYLEMTAASGLALETLKREVEVCLWFENYNISTGEIYLLILDALFSPGLLVI